MARTAREYSEILKAVITIQIQEIFERPNYENSDYLQGQVTGLYITLDKIKDSEFLLED